MAGISDFIAMATQKLGIPAGAAQAGAGGLLDLVKKQAGGDLFSQLTKVLPDAGKLAAAPSSAAASAGAPAAGGLGGMLGGLAQKAGGLLGGSGGSAIGALGMLQSAGISLDKAPGFLRAFVEFLKSKLPADLLGKVLSKVGDLKLPGA